MHAMVGLPGCRRILMVLGSQLAILVVAMAVSFSILFVAGGMPASIGRSAAMAAALALPLAVFATVGLSLTALSEPIELLLSINAKRRLRKWVLPAFAAGAALGVAALAAVSLTGAGASPAAFWLLFTLAGLAYAAPLAVLTLFAAGAAKRYLAMRNGAATMTRSTAQVSAGGADGLERVRSSIATEMGTSTTSVRPNPQGFTLAGITSRPFHDPASFAWMRAFEERFEEIRAEAESVLNIHRDRVDIYKYPGLQGDQWKAFKFVARHKPVEENMNLCPVTAGLLKTIPGYPVFRDAMFSILAPGGVIAPHRDVANIFLTAHLGLLTPPGGFIEVAGDARAWEEGQFVVFDSSYEHRAVNKGSVPRVVLLIDFLHPEVTERERAWIQQVGL